MANAGSSALSGAATGAALGSAIPGIGTVAGAIGGGLVGLAGSLFGSSSENKSTRENMKLQSNLNKQEMAYSQMLNKDYQNMLWQNQYGMQVSGMKNAGLNPAGANTSLAGASTGNAMATGPVGPKGASMQLNTLGDAIAGAKLGKELEILDSQKENIDADTQQKQAATDEQRFKNSDVYRDLILRGMDETISNTVASTSEKYSNIEVNTQKIAESAQNIKESMSRIGLNEELANKAAKEAVEVTYKIVERLQNIEESKARVIYHRAAAANQSALADLNRELKRGQGITNDDLQRWYTAKSAVLVPERGADGKETGRYRSYWGNKAAQESTQSQIQNDLLQYEYETMSTMTPAERQRYLMLKDAGQLSVDALGAFGKFVRK